MRELRRERASFKRRQPRGISSSTEPSGSLADGAWGAKRDGGAWPSWVSCAYRLGI
jgi:hypothetical protein